MIGATTENPSFEVIRPLLSRCQLYVLKSLEKDDLLELLHHAITTDVILKEKQVELRETDAMLRYSGGDARKLLNILELVVEADDNVPVVITDDKVVERLQQNPLAYDKDGEMHYDIISAFIKSIRGSDPDGALYWLARMVEGGEDPAFIARRLVISASEDIGLANPNALLLANAAFDAVMKSVGRKEEFRWLRLQFIWQQVPKATLPTKGLILLLSWFVRQGIFRFRFICVMLRLS